MELNCVCYHLWKVLHYSPNKLYTVVTMYMPDYVLPQMIRILQTEQVDLSVSSSLVNTTLHTLNDGVIVFYH